MNSSVNVLACDVGAGSGRLLQCKYNGQELTIHELSRFDNRAVPVGKCLHWDILSIYQSIRDGLTTASRRGIKPASLGIDTWGNDYALLDKNSLLMENPYSYRDNRTEGMLPYVSKHISSRQLYARNGIQQVRMNTLYQLASLAKDRPHTLDQAGQFLFIPDLLTYFLTGERACEYTLATISQLYHYGDSDWDRELMSLLHIPSHIFPSIIRPGDSCGTLLPSVAGELGMEQIPLITVGAHDTASAVAAVPEPEGSALFISSGTWSIVGTEIDAPLINEATYRHNFSNEGGVAGKIRLNKNVMGLWIIQELRRSFAVSGRDYSFADMSAMAEKAEPFGSVIDPDNSCFYSPADMPGMIQSYCQATGQIIPEGDGEIIRCALESLALKYRYVIESLEAATNQTYDKIHIVGGGSQNQLLSQLTANYCKRPVLTGPTEATALGNALLQLIALNELSGLAQARTLVKEAFPPRQLTPKPGESWDEHYSYFLSVTGIASI